MLGKMDIRGGEVNGKNVSGTEIQSGNHSI